MMPMLPAKLVRIVRAFLVIRLLSESPSAVFMDMERSLSVLCLSDLCLLLEKGASLFASSAVPSSAPSAIALTIPFAPTSLAIPSLTALASALAIPLTPSSPLYGFESPFTRPSASLIILVEYSSASSGLCVTMMTSLSSATFLRIDII